MLVVVDGRFYNAGDFGTREGEASLLALLYERHGIDAIQKLNGDFAAAIYDNETRTLWLVRDRFGTKPLYYVAKREMWGFASRPGALLGLPGIGSEPDYNFVALYAACHYRYIDNQPEHSPYAEIRQVPAAHVVCVRDGHVSIRRYWSLTDLPEFDEPEDRLAGQYRELLQDAVAIRFEVAERPAFLLSGGMDSSSVLACAKALTATRQPAVSAVYNDATYDESRDIEPAVRACADEWLVVRIGDPDLCRLVGELVECHDEPVATATWLSHYLLCAKARAAGFGALFGGLGGDELNAGEYEYFPYFFADLHASGRGDLDREIDGWVRHHDHPVFRKTRDAAYDALGRLVDLRTPGRCLHDRGRLERYASTLNPGFLDLLTFEPAMDHPFRSYLKNRTYQDLTRETIPCCLRADDRNSAAADLDSFHPFLDVRLVEFMYRVPASAKIRNGITKQLLRQAMHGVLPDETRCRIKKTGWNAPAHVWFAGPSLTALLDLIHSAPFRERGIYNVPRVLQIVDEHRRTVSAGAPAENHMMFLWQLLNLELWLRHIERRPYVAAVDPISTRASDHTSGISAEVKEGRLA